MKDHSVLIDIGADNLHDAFYLESDRVEYLVENVVMPIAKKLAEAPMAYPLQEAINDLQENVDDLQEFTLLLFGLRSAIEKVCHEKKAAEIKSKFIALMNAL